MGDIASSESFVALLIAALVFFAINTGLVSLAVGREQGISPLRVWYEKYSWSINSQITGASLVVLVDLVRRHAGPQALLLYAPYCVMLYHFYRAYFDRSVRSAHHT